MGSVNSLSQYLSNCSIIFAYVCFSVSSLAKYALNVLVFLDGLDIDFVTIVVQSVFSIRFGDMQRLSQSIEDFHFFFHGYRSSSQFFI